MTTTDFSTTIIVDKTPKEVFDAINNVRGWWSEEVEGNTTSVKDVFDYHFEDIHRCKIEVTESIPGEKVAWLVKENYFKPGIFNDGAESENAFAGHTAEWVDTKIIFEISEKDGKTQMRFTHLGLVPDYECFEACSTGWTHYIGSSLRNLITTGKGQPNATGKPQTTEEKKLKAGDTA
jgi:hypothetical protein